MSDLIDTYHKTAHAVEQLDELLMRARAGQLDLKLRANVDSLANDLMHQLEELQNILPSAQVRLQQDLASKRLNTEAS